MSASDTLFGRGTFDYGTQEQVQPYPEYSAGLETIGTFITLGENHIFSPTVLNTTRISFSMSKIIGATDIAPGFNSSDFINNAANPTSLISGWADGGVSVGGNPFTAPTAASGPLFRNQNIYAYQDDINYTHGKHSFKFGFLVNHYIQYLTADAGYKGSVTFASFPTYVTGMFQKESGLSPFQGRTEDDSLHHRGRLCAGRLARNTEADAEPRAAVRNINYAVR